jgi:hypothetical protein
MQSPGVLHYAVLPTRVGSVLVLMSSQGVVDVVPGGRDSGHAGIVQQVRSRFPGTRLLPDDGTHGSWTAAVAARIDGAAADFVVPIDLEWSPQVAPAGVTAPALCEPLV